MDVFTTSLTIKAVLSAALVFGFAPRLAVRAITLVWPREHPRRVRPALISETAVFLDQQCGRSPAS